MWGGRWWGGWAGGGSRSRFPSGRRTARCRFRPPPLCGSSGTNTASRSLWGRPTRRRRGSCWTASRGGRRGWSPFWHTDTASRSWRPSASGSGVSASRRWSLPELRDLLGGLPRRLRGDRVRLSQRDDREQFLGGAHGQDRFQFRLGQQGSGHPAGAVSEPVGGEEELGDGRRDALDSGVHLEPPRPVPFGILRPQVPVGRGFV